MRRRWLGPLLLGGAALIVGLVFMAHAVLAVLDTPVLNGQGSISESVKPGTYYLYAQSGSSHSAAIFTFTDTYAPDVDARATHLSLDGQPLVASAYDHSYSSTLTRGSRTFLAVAQVQVPHQGTLTLTADHDEGALVIAPTIGSTARKLIAPGLLALAGLVVGTGAVVYRIRAGTRRKPRWVQGGWVQDMP